MNYSEKIFVIHAFDESYGGLHGMESWEIVGDESEEQVEFDAREASLEIIDSYSQIVDELEDVVQEECDFNNIPYGEGTSEEDRIRYEVYLEDVAYCIYELDKKKLPTLNVDELDDMLYADPEEFVKKYAVNAY